MWIRQKVTSGRGKYDGLGDMNGCEWKDEGQRRQGGGVCINAATVRGLRGLGSGWEDCKRKR